MELGTKLRTIGHKPSKSLHPVDLFYSTTCRLKCQPVFQKVQKKHDTKFELENNDEIPAISERKPEIRAKTEN